MHHRSFKSLSVFLGSALLFPLVAFAQTPNDPKYNEQWYLNVIHAPAAWDITTGSSDVIVAVLDTGLDITHEDIAENLWVNTKEIADNKKDDDGNGFVDDVNGWDFIDNDNTPSPNPSDDASKEALNHGTLVAGEIGAVGNNHLGVSGVNWQVRIMPVRMLDDQGSGTEFDAANAIRYAVRNGARVINLSFAGNEAHTALQAAVKDAYEKGVVIVAALGNDARDTDVTPVYPACLRTVADDWVIGVTAVDRSGRGTAFTNYGTQCADVAAPGMQIYGLAYPQNSAASSELYRGGWNGTSMASPLVAGAAALLFAQYPTLSPTDVRNILKLSVDPVRIVGYERGELGAGQLNLERALILGASYAPAAKSSPSSSSPAAESDEPSSKADVATGSDDVLKYSFAIFGAPAGSAPMVDVRRANGSSYAQFAAYGENFRGGVRVATINTDHDGTPEIVTGAGESGGPHVRVFKAFGSVLHEFFAYDRSSSHGVSVATGDVNGDGEDDIVTAVGSDVSRDVIVWSESGEEIFRFTASAFPASSALSVSTADIDSDVAQEVIVTGVIDGEVHVAVYDNDGKYLVDFIPFAGASSVSVSAGDRDGDLVDDLLVSSRTVGNSVNIVNTIGALRSVVTLHDQQSNGTNVVGIDLDLDSRDDILTYEHRDGGLVTLVSSDGKTLFGSWNAPTFSSKAAAFFTGW